MTKITDIFPKVKQRAGDVGIEVEVEGKEALTPLTAALTEHWIEDADGTLRGGFGREYKSRQPFYLNNAFEKKIASLVDHIRQTKINEDSANTSVHVHHNVSNRTIMEVLNATTAWWLLENLLVHHCGPDREANMFCLRLCDAEAIVPRLLASLEAGTIATDLSDRSGDSYRYAGVNLKAVAEFGSLEIRTMRGTVATGVISEWAREINGMINKACAFRTPEDVFNYLIRVSKMDFVNYFFSPDFANRLTNQYGWQDKLDQSAVLVCNFAYGLEWPQWEKRFAEKIKKTKPEKKKVNVYDQILGAAGLGGWQEVAAPVAYDFED